METDSIKLVHVSDIRVISPWKHIKQVVNSMMEGHKNGGYLWRCRDVFVDAKHNDVSVARCHAETILYQIDNGILSFHDLVFYFTNVPRIKKNHPPKTDTCK